jgi:Uma2 family endonuclease
MIPMSRPRWFDELPESMSEAEYRELPEDVARTIEVVYGHVIKCGSPAPRHNRIARRLSFALESARSPAGPCLTVETDVDVVLWRVPRFTFRHPDVIVYECIDDPARKPTAQETVREFHLDAATSAYRLHAVHRSVLDLEQPVRLLLPISDLVAP